MMKGKGLADASNNKTHIQIDSSDSDSEGFVGGNGSASENLGVKTVPGNDKILPSPTGLLVGKAQPSSKAFGKITEITSPEYLKSGKRVSFDNPKSGKKAMPEIPTTNAGESAKGGKEFASGKDGGKAGEKGGARSANVPAYDVELKLELELPEGKPKILMDCEAAEILQGIQERLTGLSSDNLKMPESFHKALHQSQAGSHYTSNQSARQILDDLKTYGVTEGEICMIANVSPETVDEAYALIPSLKALRIQTEAPLKDALSKLMLFRA